MSYEKKFVVFLILLSSLSGCLPLYRLFNISPSIKLKNVAFEEKEINPEYIFYYPDSLNNEYLRKLRCNYGLDTLILPNDNDFDKIKKILDWTHRQWIHSGNNTPSKSDPLTILEEAGKGNKFRCVEYGIVSAAALNSFNIPARVLSLKTADVEKVKYGAGHVAAECYSSKFQKWIFIDGQFNAIPVLDNIPLNAVEFKKAIANNKKELKIINLEGELSAKDIDKYINWIGKYLYYFDINFDNRIISDQVKINEKTKLMLVPLNASNPGIFQRRFKIDYCIYTHNLNDFYRKPK